MVITAVAFNTFREAIRDRVLLNIFFFSLVMVGLSIVMSKWSLGQEQKLMIDFGLTIISLFGLLVAVFIGIGLVYKEIDRRTIYIILSKPIKRSQFVIGKFLGLASTLLVLLVLMGGILCGFLLLFGGTVPGLLLVAIGLLYWEMLIMLGISLAFSCVTTPMISALMSIFLYIIGHLSADIRILGPGIDSAPASYIMTGLYYVLPNLERFNISAEVVHNLPISAGAIIMASIYGIIYSIALIVLATIILNKREFQ